MKLMSALRIDVADLLTHPGARRPLHLEAAVADLGGTAARVDEPVVVDLVLQRAPDGRTRSNLITQEHDQDGSPQATDPASQDAPAPRVELAPRRPVPLHLPELRRGEAAAHRVRQLRLVRRPPGDRRLLTRWASPS